MKNKLALILSAIFLLFSIYSTTASAEEPIGAPLPYIKVKQGKLKFNKNTGLSQRKIRLKNRLKPKAKIFGSLALVITSINKSDVTVANATGKTSANLPYVIVPLPVNGLNPKKLSLPVTLAFNNPNKRKFKATYAVYSAGSANIGTSVGAFGVLVLANSTIGFIPDRSFSGPTAGSPVVKLVSLQGSNSISAKRTGITNSSTDFAATTAANPPEIVLSDFADSCAVDPTVLKVVCIGFDSTTINVLDIAKFSVTLKLSDISVSSFDSQAPNTYARFSGGSCKLCGVLADSGDNRFVVSANDGYRVYTYGAPTPAVYKVPINENFAFDSVRNLIIAPEYDRNFSTRTRPFRIINLNKNRIYTWTKDTASCADLGSSASFCDAFADLDSSTVDPTTGIVGFIFEHRTSVAMIDMGQAVYNENTLTFTAPPFLYTETNPLVKDQSAGASSSTGHFLLTAEELGFNSQIGVMKMPASSGTGNVFPTLNPNPVYVELNNVPNPECGGSSSTFRFTTKGDPHGLGLFTGLLSKETGILINRNNTCAALIDLKALYEAPRSASNSTQLDPSVNLRASNIVQFVNIE